MLWQTHIRIANEVLQRLGIPKSTIEADRLKEGVLAPDKWGDYPHHYGKSHAIAKLWTSRFGYVNYPTLKGKGFKAQTGCFHPI
jgi:hypothetical protein